MGREALKHPAVPPKLAYQAHLVLTIISLSSNVEITVRTTSATHLHTNGSRGNFN